MENAVVVNGITRSSHAFGANYLAELRRVLLQHVKPVTRTYLEWGMGNSTLAILQMREDLPVDEFFSIDDNQDYVDQLVAQLPPWSGFHPMCFDLTGPRRSDRDPEPNYSTWPLSLARTFDFIYIDGRRRMECALVAALMCHRETTVVLHDYRRARYRPVTLLFDTLEEGAQFRVMRRRRNLVRHERWGFLRRFDRPRPI